MPSTLGKNLALAAAVCTTLAGAVGSFVIPIWGQSVATELRDILQALSAVLLVIGGGGATAVAVTTSRARALARIAAPHAAVSANAKVERQDHT